MGVGGGARSETLRPPRERTRCSSGTSRLTGPVGVFGFVFKHLVPEEAQTPPQIPVLDLLLRTR